MRARSASTITVDLIRSVVDVGELAKLAMKLGMDLEVSEGTDEPEKGPHVQAILDRSEAEWLETEIVDMLLVHAYASSRSIDEIFEGLRSELGRRHVPMGRPIQDVMEIGGGKTYEEPGA